MGKADDVRRLKRIVEVRSAQEQAAETSVARASQALALAERDQDDGRQWLGSCQASWAQSLGATRLPLDLARAWSAAVVEAEAKLRERDSAHEAAAVEKAEMADAWRLARARSEAASEVTDRAARRLRRAREEAALDAAADRAALKATSP